MKPGPSVSLKCSGSGNPTPKILWYLDGFPIQRVSLVLVYIRKYQFYIKQKGNRVMVSNPDDPSIGFRLCDNIVHEKFIDCTGRVAEIIKGIGLRFCCVSRC